MTVEPVTLQRIERALAVLAKVIRRNPNGEQAWPIFERLESEREKLMGREDRLEQAIRRRPGRRPASSPE